MTNSLIKNAFDSAIDGKEANPYWKVVVLLRSVQKKNPEMKISLKELVQLMERASDKWERAIENNLKN